jgi:hypothetical protein
LSSPSSLHSFTTDLGFWRPSCRCFSRDILA